MTPSLQAAHQRHQGKCIAIAATIICLLDKQHIQQCWYDTSERPRWPYNMRTHSRTPRPSLCSPAASMKHHLPSTSFTELPTNNDTFRLDTQLRTAQVASASSILRDAQTIVDDCTKHGFVVVNQPGVSPADFAAHQYTPFLKSRLSGADKKTKTAVTISNVVGHFKDVDRIYLASQDLLCSTNADWKYTELDLGMKPGE